MGRQEAIARSVVRAVKNGGQRKSRSPIAWILALLSAFFSFYQLPLRKVRPETFTGLRRKQWALEDDDYVASFRPAECERDEQALKAIGDMGFSGSVSNGKALSIYTLDHC